MPLETRLAPLAEWPDTRPMTSDSLPAAAAHIRPARADDYEAYTGLFPELEIDDLIPPRDSWLREQRATTLVAELDGAAVGYGFYRTLADTGYVTNLVVAPSARRAGVGRALMDAMAARFRAAGATNWCLNVKVDNAPAIRLYERCGLLARYDSAVMRIRWELIDALPAPSSAATARMATTADAERIERALALLPGKVMRRPLDAEHRVPMVLVDDAERVIGFADFVTTFPGAFPFRVARPELAGALLRALRPHARPEHERVQIVIDDDPATCDLLSAAGATTFERIRHYRGPLPPG